MWSDPQATLGETSQGPWVGWTVVPDQVWDSAYTSPRRQRDHVETQGDRAEVETVGEGSDVSQGTGEGAKGCSTEEEDGEERDGESEDVGR